MFTIDFWKAAGERAIRAFAFAVTGFIGVGAALGDIDWLQAASVGAVAAILSILTGITVNAVTGDGPAINKTEQVITDHDVLIKDVVA